MKRVLTWLFPAEFLREPAYFRGIALAGLYVALLLAQLFTFEKFAEVTLGFGLPGGIVTAWVLAVMIPMIELMAVPYLISMRLGARLYRISRWCVIAVPVLWLLLAFWQLLASGASQLNAGLFGATLTVPVGLWFIVFSAIMLWAVVLVVRELPVRRS
ncbi:MAG: hypothetical protein WBP22_04560 [Candidatus Saccharimonas sp.]